MLGFGMSYQVFLDGKLISATNTENLPIIRLFMWASANDMFATKNTVQVQRIGISPECVTGDTQLSVIDSGQARMTQIKDIKEGEKVLTYDEATGKFVPQMVEKLLEKGTQPVFELETSTGKKIRTTSEHPYLTRVLGIRQEGINNLWIKVKNLKPGQKIMTIDGFEEIKSIEKLGREEVFDIQIANTHNFVGNGIVAHNTLVSGVLGDNLALKKENGCSNCPLLNTEVLKAVAVIKQESLGDRPTAVTENLLPLVHPMKNKPYQAWLEALAIELAYINGTPTSFARDQVVAAYEVVISELDVYGETARKEVDLVNDKISELVAMRVRGSNLTEIIEVLRLEVQLGIKGGRFMPNEFVRKTLIGLSEPDKGFIEDLIFYPLGVDIQLSQQRVKEWVQVEKVGTLLASPLLGVNYESLPYSRPIDRIVDVFKQIGGVQNIEASIKRRWIQNDPKAVYELYSSVRAKWSRVIDGKTMFINWQRLLDFPQDVSKLSNLGVGVQGNYTVDYIRSQLMQGEKISDVYKILGGTSGDIYFVVTEQTGGKRILVLKVYDEVNYSNNARDLRKMKTGSLMDLTPQPIGLNGSGNFSMMSLGNSLIQNLNSLLGISVEKSKGLLPECVTGDTLLTTINNSQLTFNKPIKDIKVGEQVLTFDEKSQKFIYSTVEKLLPKGVQQVFELTTELNKKIRTTSEHPYLTEVKRQPVRDRTRSGKAKGKIEELEFGSAGKNSPADSAAYKANITGQGVVFKLRVEDYLKAIKKETKGDTSPNVGHQVDWLRPFAQTARSREVVYQSEDVMSSLWVKVKNLKPGQKIMTLDGFEEIKSIKKLGWEEVFDIQIANTHNFVGNGVVAHNTVESDPTDETVSLADLVRFKVNVPGPSGRLPQLSSQDTGTAGILGTNEQSDGEIFRDASQGQSAPNGYIIGPTVGNIFTMLKAFNPRVPPKGIVVVDVNPQVIGAGKILERLFKTNGDYSSFRKMLRDKGAVRNIWREVLREEKDPYVQSQLVAVLFFDLYEELNARSYKDEGTPFADRNGTLRLNAIGSGSQRAIAVGAAIRESYAIIHDLAVKGNFVLVLGDLLDPEIQLILTNLPSYQRLRHLIYVSNIADIVSEIDLDGLLKMQSLDGFGNGNIWVDSLRSSGYRLRLHRKPPRYTQGGRGVVYHGIMAHNTQVSIQEAIQSRLKSPAIQVDIGQMTMVDESIKSRKYVGEIMISGERKPVFVKVFKPEADRLLPEGYFTEEIRNAQILELAGIGAKYYGTADIGDGSMAYIVEAVDLGSGTHAVTSKTIDELKGVWNKLIRIGYIPVGDVQFVTNSNGGIVIVDPESGLLREVRVYSQDELKMEEEYFLRNVVAPVEISLDTIEEGDNRGDGGGGISFTQRRGLLGRMMVRTLAKGPVYAFRMGIDDLFQEPDLLLNLVFPGRRVWLPKLVELVNRVTTRIE